jgi:hypothetical protein
MNLLRKKSTVVHGMRVQNRLVNHDASLAAVPRDQSTHKLNDRDLILVERRKPARKVEADRILRWGFKLQLLRLSHLSVGSVEPRSTR